MAVVASPKNEELAPKAANCASLAEATAAANRAEAGDTAPVTATGVR